jgi:hypothetical protein
MNFSGAAWFQKPAGSRVPQVWAAYWNRRADRGLKYYPPIGSVDWGRKRSCAMLQDLTIPGTATSGRSCRIRLRSKGLSSRKTRESMPSESSWAIALRFVALSFQFAWKTAMCSSLRSISGWWRNGSRAWRHIGRT